MKIVPFNEKVFDALFEWQQDPEIRKSMGGMSVELTEDELRAEYNMFLVGKSRVYGVELETGEIAGAFIAEGIYQRHKRFECHIVFGKKFRRHMKEASTMFMDHMFNEMNFEWMHCIVPEHNEVVIKGLMKCGAVKRCTIPQYYNFQDGEESAVYLSLHKNKRRY